MEYRFEADGDSFCDPQNPLRAPGAFGDKSVVEFPGYRPPAWLAAPDPGPAVPVAEHARLWSPPDTDPRRPLPLLVAHDGCEYERLSQLTRLIAHAIADEPDPALPRRAARRPRPQRGLLRLGPLRPHARRHPPPARPGHRPSPGSARASARSRCCTRAGCTPARSARCMLQSGSFFRQRWDRQESGFPRFRRISRFVGTVLQRQPRRHADPDHAHLRRARGEPRQQPRRRDRAAPPGPRRRRCTSTATRTTTSAGATRSTRTSSTLLARAWG